MASLAERAGLLPEEVPSGHGVDLLVGHLLRGLDAPHLEHHLLQDEQVEALLALELGVNSIEYQQAVPHDFQQGV